MRNIVKKSWRGTLVATEICVAAVCAAKPAAERMDRSKLLIGAYCLQKNAKTDAHIKAIHDCGVDFIIGGLPASDHATLDLFAKHGVGAIVDGVVPRWWAGVERSGKMRAANPPEKYAAGAAAFKDHPAIWAIDIGDEPSALDFSEACRRTKRSFWYVPQVNSRRRLAPTSENRLRFQAYTALSFGAEVITWACWCKGWWANNVLDAAGRQTEQSGKLKRVNAELKYLGPHYMRFRNVATRFVGFAPDSPRCPQLPHSAAPDDPGYVKASNGAPLVVGEMVARDPASHERAFFVTAADDPTDVHPAKFDIVFNVKAKRVEALG